MLYDKQQIAASIMRWKGFLSSFSLPAWDELPEFDLYMDQVIVMLNRYLSYFIYEGNDEKLITASMVNNYVKMKLIPPPVKKKYGRPHLACLMMVCTLKQTLSMAFVKKLLPRGDDEAIRRGYEQFVAAHRELSAFFVEQVRENATALYDPKLTTDKDIHEMIMRAAVTSCFAKLLAGKTLALQIPDTPQKGTK